MLHILLLIYVTYYRYMYFLNCYLTALHPTLDHCLLLFTTSIRFMTRRSPGAMNEFRALSPTECLIRFVSSTFRIYYNALNHWAFLSKYYNSFFPFIILINRCCVKVLSIKLSIIANLKVWVLPCKYSYGILLIFSYWHSNCWYLQYGS